MQEVWLPVIGYDGIYEISNMGRIKSVDRIIKTKYGVIRTRKGIMRSPFENTLGYLQIVLHHKGTRKIFAIHRLVAFSFIPKVKGKDFINHIDGNKKNNKTNNLEWCTASENISHAVKTGLLVVKNGEETGYSKVKEKDVISIREMHANGAKYKEIEETFHIKKSTIWNIVKNHSWKHLLS